MVCRPPLVALMLLGRVMICFADPHCSPLHEICRSLKIHFDLPPEGSKFNYDNAFLYRVF